MEVSDRLLKRRVPARQHVFVETLQLSWKQTCKLPTKITYLGLVERRRFSIVIKTIEMYSISMHLVPL